MPNWSSFTMRAVAPKTDTLERLIRIMKYEDAEYYIYKTELHVHGDIEESGDDDGLYCVDIMGCVAWSTTAWFEYPDCVSGTSHATPMDILCQRLDFGVEIFSEVYRVGESWVKCNHHGEVCSNFEAFTVHCQDSDGNPLDTPVVEGGLEGYGDFSDCDLIYG